MRFKSRRRGNRSRGRGGKNNYYLMPRGGIRFD